MGDYMASNGLIPNRVLCSSARRAVETWELVSTFFEDSIRFEITQDLYEASPGNLLDILQQLPPETDTVLLVGHNPTFEELASALAGSGRPESLAELDRKYPTGALAVIDFSVGGWPDVRAGAGYLRDFVRPRSLKP